MGHASRLVASAFALLVAAPTALADHAHVEAGAFFGGDVFGDNIELGNSFYDDQVPGNSPLFGLRAAYRFAGRFALEIEGTLAPSSTDGKDGRPSISATVLGYRAHAMIFQPLSEEIELFGLVGAGAETALFGNAPDRLAIDSPDTDTEAHWGVGARYLLAGGHYGARLDLRQAVTAGRDPSLTLTYELHLGAFVSFGAGKPETVVVERVVEKPVAPPRPQVTDTDGDGIEDKNDRCPGQAEVVNGIDDEDGCPEIDSDNDGLLGSRDQCPDAAEDADGFEDDDGCPDLDNDGDGRPDRIDACPMDAETLNGFEDADGCPDEIPPEVQEFTGVIKGIRFKRNSARILSRSHRTLDKAVRIFKRYPSLRIEISGYTDNQGSAKTNIRLSRKRADSVKWYLVDKGVDPNRIVTLGHGPEKPIADNGSRKGRAQNRRIEFRLLPGPASIELDDSGAPVPAPPAGGDAPDEGATE